MRLYRYRSRPGFIHVFSDGRFRIGGMTYACALGKGGVGPNKREGDGRTPSGRFRLRRLHYRADRLGRPRASLPKRPIHRRDGWCDDVRHARYNRGITRPFRASHEILWRNDGLYDLVIEIGYNDAPPKRGLGSAIFLHVARTGYAPTEGCVALSLKDYRAVLPKLTSATWISIHR